MNNLELESSRSEKAHLLATMIEAFKIKIASHMYDKERHVQYCQLDSIGKNRTSIRPVCSIWRTEKFLDDPTSIVLYPTIASH